MSQFVGTVTKKRFGAGSKSDHPAVLLQSGTHEYILRRQGGNPFYDEALEKLVGKNIRAQGDIVGDYTLLMSDWSEVCQPTPPSV